MKTLIKSILAVTLAAIGLQMVAEKLDFSKAFAGPGDDEPEDFAGGNRIIGF